LVPKALTLDRSETLAVLVARPIEMISVALRPVVWVLQSTASLLLRPFGIREVVAGEAVRTPADLRALVDEAEGSGVIPRAQEELLHNVFDFADHEALDIMVPKLDVDWIEASLTTGEALERVRDGKHSRYPVGDESLDRLVGVVHLRDLIAGEGSVRELARPAYVVPETKDLGALLREMRERHEQLAVVIDEYGAVAGIVTIEDLLEEIVGEIEDEFDLPDATLTWEDDRVVRASGSMTIDDFEEAVGVRLPHTGSRTLAGLVLDRLGRRPDPGDSVELEGVEIRVDGVDGLRITDLRISLGDAR
jgi:putative hemolysin